MPCPAPIGFDRRPGTEIPGYTGHVPRKEQVYGETFVAANDQAAGSAGVDAKGTTRARSISRERQRTLQPQVTAGSYCPTYDKARFFRLGGRSGRGPKGPDAYSAAWSAGLRSAEDDKNETPVLTSEWRYMRSPALDLVQAEGDSQQQPSSLSPERVIAGYAGHIPHVRSNNVVGKTFRAANEAAYDGDPTAMRSPSPAFARAKTSPRSWALGYAGHTPRIKAENIYGLTSRLAYDQAASMEKEAAVNGPPDAIPLTTSKKSQLNNQRTTNRKNVDVVDVSTKGRESPQGTRRSLTPQKIEAHAHRIPGHRANENAAIWPDTETKNNKSTVKSAVAAQESRIDSKRHSVSRSPSRSAPPSARSSKSTQSGPELSRNLIYASLQNSHDVSARMETGGAFESQIGSQALVNKVPETLLSPSRYERQRDREEGPPFGRECTGEIPSFIDHVPRKNRTGETPVTSARGPHLQKKSRSLSPRPLRRDMPSYAGHVPRVGPENVYGVSHTTASRRSASMIPSVNEGKASSIRSGSSQCADLQQNGRPCIPGYAGYIPRKGPCNILGATFGTANERAAMGVDPATAAETETVMLQMPLC